MRIRKYRLGDESSIKRIYQACFSGPPWNQQVTPEESAKQWEDHSSRPNFTCFVGEEDHRLVGATWYDSVSFETLAKERGQELVDFIQMLGIKTAIIWIRETIVDPKHREKGYASRLKSRAIKEIASSPTPVLLLTRMRDDNVKIVHLNETLGFKRTGIKVASKATPGLFHEYWYLPFG